MKIVLALCLCVVILCLIKHICEVGANPILSDMSVRD